LPWTCTPLSISISKV